MVCVAYKTVDDLVLLRRQMRHGGKRVLSNPV